MFILFYDDDVHKKRWYIKKLLRHSNGSVWNLIVTDKPQKSLPFDTEEAADEIGRQWQFVTEEVNPQLRRNKEKEDDSVILGVNNDKL